MIPHPRLPSFLACITDQGSLGTRVVLLYITRYADRILTIKDLNVVRKTLWEIRAQYKSLGIELGLGIGDIEAIEGSNHYEVDACFIAVLTELLGIGLSQEKLALTLDLSATFSSHHRDLANIVWRNFRAGTIHLIYNKNMLSKLYCPMQMDNYLINA